MPTTSSSRADQRRTTVVAAAVAEFARGGYHGTTIAAVGERAGISPAYVFKLFPGKPRLFAAALDSCYARILDTLTQVAEANAGEEADVVLDRMGAAYAELIADRDVLSMQAHALSAVQVEEIRSAMVEGTRTICRLVTDRTGADATALQGFMARGQLCHLIVMLDLDDSSAQWAQDLSTGFRHPPRGSTART